MARSMAQPQACVFFFCPSSTYPQWIQWFPANHVSQTKSTLNQAGDPTVLAGTFVAKFAFTGSHEDELPLLCVSDVVRVIEAPPGGWWRGTLLASGVTGWFPSDYVVPSEALAVGVRPLSTKPAPSGLPLPTVTGNPSSDLSTALLFVRVFLY
jgi:hypothetical protein